MTRQTDIPTRPGEVPPPGRAQPHEAASVDSPAGRDLHPNVMEPSIHEFAGGGAGDVEPAQKTCSSESITAPASHEPRETPPPLYTGNGTAAGPREPQMPDYIPRRYRTRTMREWHASGCHPASRDGTYCIAWGGAFCLVLAALIGLASLLGLL